MSIPLEKCMKCLEECDLLLSCCSHFGVVIGDCDHKFCQRCFRLENINMNATNTTYNFTCPCCSSLFYENMRSIDEAILIGEAATLSTHLSPKLSPPADAVISDEYVSDITQLSKVVIEKLEAALRLNPSNFDTLYFLSRSCYAGLRFLINNDKLSDTHSILCRLKLFEYSYNLLDHPSLSECYESVKAECSYKLATVFGVRHNYPAALEYAKLAYEYCLRSSDHRNLSRYKNEFIRARTSFAKLPPLRFAVGDEVEFLDELETGSEWRLGKVVELYYIERSFDIHFSAPYRLQLLDGSDSADEPPVYAWVKADLDRYVRKVGVRSIEDTRYQARLDGKVAELAQIYSSKEFIEDVYLTLSQDREFVDMLLSVWRIELSEEVLRAYRMLVMHRQPLIRVDSGYHVPSSEEVIAGIRAFFDPTHLISDATPAAAGEDRDSPQVRAEIMCFLRGELLSSTSSVNVFDIQGLLLGSIGYYVGALVSSDATGSCVDIFDKDSSFTVPPALSEAISKAATAEELRFILFNCGDRASYEKYLNAWYWLHLCLENPKCLENPVGSACECPFVYFFVKSCLDHGLGVPKLALALYDRMNMQLSREFIRCANPTCELNKLDKSTGQVKFKKCSRCQAVIYCSRECQVTHYPDHKRLCREHSTG